MFWIIGGDVIARQLLAGSEPNSPAGRLLLQFEHVAWEGFVFYDLIFPLFLFLVGCVIPYSLQKYSASPKLVYGRIFRRGGFLILLGLLYNGVLQLEFADMRYPSVLQRIGICYMVASLIFLHTQWKMQVVITTAILLGYWGIFAFIPAPGGVAGDYSIEGNLGGYIDRAVLPGIILEKYYGFGDNEGILSTLPAIATVLLGCLTGTMLRSGLSPWRKVLVMLVAGIASICLGYYWGQSFPIIKNLWTSSFVLVTAGWSLVLLALFYILLDIFKWRWLAFFWIVIGINPITIYVLQEFVNFYEIAEFFFGGLARLSGDSQTLVIALGIMTIKWLLLYFLYRHKIFLRV